MAEKMTVPLKSGSPLAVRPSLLLATPGRSRTVTPQAEMRPGFSDAECEERPASQSPALVTHCVHCGHGCARRSRVGCSRAEGTMRLAVTRQRGSPHSLCSRKLIKDVDGAMPLYN